MHVRLGHSANAIPKDNHFHLSCPWPEMITDTEVLKRAGMHSVHTLLKLVQLRWAGEATRMPDERLTKKLFFGEL